MSSLPDLRDGALVVDKPAGPTSHDVVAAVRRAVGVPRIGHTGTLDPLATGVLVLLVGRATRLAQFLNGSDKEYLADVRLGFETETDDAEAPPEGETPFDPAIDVTGMPAALLDEALAGFRGLFWQTPPQFSAKKVGGRRAYAQARLHQHVELKPVEVRVHELERLSYRDGRLRLRIVCSAGFYVRSFARDLGRRLGCGAHLASLQRTRAGQFALADARPLDEVLAGGPGMLTRLVAMGDLIGDLAPLTLTEEGIRRVAHGNSVAPEHVAAGATPGLRALRPGSKVRLLDAAGDLLAVADLTADALLHPAIVLV
ncbi:MAG TPA: tRNA pseudouridine(55) synthase TruB [Vicinamibacterales bacterium]|nr:tRNA pseudouridine(55) synthase TruB [Vicinamibacterales bacterium]